MHNFRLVCGRRLSPIVAHVESISVLMPKLNATASKYLFVYKLYLFVYDCLGVYCCILISVAKTNVRCRRCA